MALNTEAQWPIVQRADCGVSCSSQSAHATNSEAEVVIETIDNDDMEMLSGIDENTQEHGVEEAIRGTLTKSIASSAIPRMTLRPSAKNLARTILSPSMSMEPSMSKLNKDRQSHRGLSGRKIMDLTSELDRIPNTQRAYHAINTVSDMPEITSPREGTKSSKTSRSRNSKNSGLAVMK